MGVSIEVHINVDSNVKKIDNDAFWTFAANEWWRLITPFTPMQTGALMESVSITPKTVEYTAPYSHRVYEGVYMNFHRDKHPQASARWDEAAIPTQQDKLINACQKYINKINF